MKVLGSPKPTSEQLKIIGNTSVGTEVIRGAAGSGKTTTALLRLRNLTDMFKSRHQRLEIEAPVRALVLTFNRTLCGYVEALANAQASASGGVELYVDTFARWALQLSGNPRVLSNRRSMLLDLAAPLQIGLQPDFLCAEVEYALGRFLPNERANYLTKERSGRGLAPRVDAPVRRKILTLIDKYLASLKEKGLVDWEDLPVAALQAPSEQFEVIVVDEAQDFSANQIRAVLHHLAKQHALTLVIDTIQRLYPRGYLWNEVGIVQPKFHRLSVNFRNTVEIAAFAQGIISGLTLDDDGTMPDLKKATRSGPKPIVIVGLFRAQIRRALELIEKNIDLQSESVAFLHPLGGGFFSFIRTQLQSASLSFEEITREREWPSGGTNIVLSTMHSAKGLEFDHVIILGLNDEVTAHGDDTQDDKLVTLRRLLAMAVARARNSVLIGYKESSASKLVDFFQKGTFDEELLA